MWWIPELPGLGDGDGLALGDGEGLGLGVGDGLGVGVGVGPPAGVGVGVGDAPGVGVGLGCPDGGWLGEADGLGVGATIGLVVTDGNRIGLPRTGWTPLGLAAGGSSAGPPHDRTHAKDGMRAIRKSLMLFPPLEMTLECHN
jgi:hypothetical protein